MALLDEIRAEIDQREKEQLRLSDEIDLLRSMLHDATKLINGARPNPPTPVRQEAPPKPKPKRAVKVPSKPLADRPVHHQPTTRDGKPIDFEPMLAALAKAGPEGMRPSELAPLVNVDSGKLNRKVKRLVEQGAVRVEGTGAGTRYHLCKSAAAEINGGSSNGDSHQQMLERREASRHVHSLRDRILEVLRGHPRTEVQMVGLLRAERDDVAEAAGQLLDEGIVCLHGDGRYEIVGAA